MDIKGIAQLANVTGTAGGKKPGSADKKVLDQKVKDNVREWFVNHPELLLSSLPAADELPSGILKLLKLKPPHSGELKDTTENGDAILRFHGLLSGPPDLESPVDEQYHGYQLWETLEVGGRVYLPGKNMSFTTPQLVSASQGRGGAFTDWLVNRLWIERRKNAQDISAIPKARQSSPPPLYLEGLKVQTPWLFQFLKNPELIRHETVLRMPRFNMSDAEARALANYFAAVDDSQYPYQTVPEREPAYLAKMNDVYHQEFAKDADEHEDYLNRSWHMLGKNPLCVTCHSVMGREFKAPDPTQVTHGPDLDTRVPSRLRPDWLEVWLNTPRWMLPYTGMPAPHTKPQKGYFGDDPERQTTALRDALINYNRLIQTEGVIKAPPPEPATPAGAPAGME